MKKLLTLIIILSITLTGWAQTISGTVKDADTREPLPFASIFFAGTSTGTTTDSEGNFSLPLPVNAKNTGKLVLSYVGYKTDTIKFSSGQTRYNILLQPSAGSLNEVMVISGTMKEVSKMNSPIPVEVYTPALFRKNPTPSIFESLAMINGVQPQLNCNVCNTGDIHINGMEGPYTMVLIDGMPIVSSLSTVYGLSGIPNSLVKRIEVVKGPASTLYGSEAVGGLINIITRDAITSPRFNTDLSGTTFGEFNLDLGSKWKAGKSQALLGINYFTFQNRADHNNDNFTDVTLQDRISAFNKWNFSRPHNRQASLALRYIYEDRWGGEMQWNKQYRGSGEIYGESIYTNRVEAIGNYQLPVHNENIFVDFSYNYHLQDSYYGEVKYLADQHVAFGQVRWDKKIQRHDLLMGIPFRFIYYNDNTPGTRSDDGNDQPMYTYLPGIFIQDEWSVSKPLTLLSGIRYDRHNHHGNILSPRLSFKYSPDSNNTFRLSSGNGFRVVNLFTEDHAALTGSRLVIIKNELKPEQSWNVNLNYTRQISHNTGYIGLDASVFYTYFTNKIVGDFLTEPNAIIYDNLSGYAVSRGVTINTDFAFINSLKILAGVTLMDVFQTEKDGDGIEVKVPQLFAPRVSGTYAISYSLDRVGITFDLTGRLNGPMHLPVVPNDHRPEKSPWFSIVNVQMSKAFTNGLELYGGVKNLLNFIPKDPLFNPSNPFDETFDTTYNYAPVQGIRGFAGIRYTFH